MHGGQHVERIVVGRINFQGAAGGSGRFGKRPFLPVTAGQSGVGQRAARIQRERRNKIFVGDFVILQQQRKHSPLAHDLGVTGREFDGPVQRFERAGEIAAVQTFTGEFQRVQQQVLNGT